MHSALDAFIYRFSNDGPHFKAKIVDPKNSGPISRFVATWEILSRHSFHLCSLGFVVACSFYRDMVLCFLLGFCHDIVFIFVP